jgi:antitoxin component YwqK of YwqJK toxin-antitoxin module
MSIKDKAGKKPTNGPWSYVEEVISGIHQKYQGFYVDGEKQGDWSVHCKEDHIEGEEGEFLGWEVTYMHGVIKRFSEYWSDGGIRSITVCKDGEPVGTTRYYRNGNIEALVERDGDSHKTYFSEWYDNGNKRREGTYMHYFNKASNSYHSKKVDKWTYWHPNGKVKFTGQYRKSGEFYVRSGIWSTFYANGIKESDTTYINGEELHTILSPNNSKGIQSNYGNMEFHIWFEEFYDENNLEDDGIDVNGIPYGC